MKKSKGILEGKAIAILAADGFEHSELFEPMKALEKAGAEVHIISLKKGSIKSWKNKDWGESIEVDDVVSRANPEQFAALVLPGGVISPDLLRGDEKAVAFAKAFIDSGKPVAAICHGPQTLISAGVLGGQRMTSWPGLQVDCENAGADWVDEEVVVDQGLITSRKPTDLPAFNRKMIEEFAKGNVVMTEEATPLVEEQPTIH